MTQFFGITWANPAYVWLLPIVILGILFLVYGIQRRRQAIRQLSGFHTSVMKGYSPFKMYVKLLLSSFALLSLWIALLRPQWRKRNEVIAQEGRDLLIALDISR